MLSNIPSNWKNCEVNSNLWSQVTWSGTLCLVNTWWRNNFAILGASTLSCVRMLMSCLLAWSTMLRMAVWLLEGGSCSMKLKEMECHGHSGIGSCCTSLNSLCHRLWQNSLRAQFYSIHCKSHSIPFEFHSIHRRDISPHFCNILWDCHCLRGGKWWFLCCWHWAWQSADHLASVGTWAWHGAWQELPLLHHVGTCCHLTWSWECCSLSYPIPYWSLVIGMGNPW